MKKKPIILTVIIFAIAAVIVTGIVIITNRDDGTMKEAESLEDFIKQSEKGKLCKVQAEPDGKNAILIYDGDSYYIEGEGEKYKYLLDVEGKLKDTEKTGRIVAISNTRYDYEKIAWSVLSSSTEDWLEDCKILLWDGAEE